MMQNESLTESGQTLNKAKRALILLHGRGGTSHDLLGIADECCDDTFYISAPQAEGHSWYPHSFLTEEKLNEPWLSLSVEMVKKLIDEISRTIPKDQIFLLGFSQGACLALETTARHAAKYGGIVAFTGGLVGAAIDEKKYSGRFENTKVFIGNSDKDPHVPLARSYESKEVMERMGAQVTLKIYPGMSHTVNQDEINWVKNLFEITQ